MRLSTACQKGLRRRVAPNGEGECNRMTCPAWRQASTKPWLSDGANTVASIGLSVLRAKLDGSTHATSYPMTMMDQHAWWVQTLTSHSARRRSWFSTNAPYSSHLLRRPLASAATHTT